MRRLMTIAALLAAAGWTATAAQDEAKKLEGTYTVLEIITEGKPSPKAKELKSAVIKGDTITLTIARGEKSKDEVAKFKLDPSKKPAHIDIMPDRGEGKQIAGIYKTEETDKGLVLTMAFAGGPKEERPTDFKGEGDDAMVMKLLRKKDK